MPLTPSSDAMLGTVMLLPESSVPKHNSAQQHNSAQRTAALAAEHIGRTDGLFYVLEGYTFVYLTYMAYIHI